MSRPPSDERIGGVDDPAGAPSSPAPADEAPSGRDSFGPESTTAAHLVDILRALVAKRAGAATDAPDGPYRTGQLIVGKYRLDRCLGVGGMGAVWLARNEVLEAEVALKLIRPHLAALAPVTERLLKEARASAKLQHPGIVRAFDFGKTEQGHPFIVMEMLHGASLADVLDASGRLSDVAAVRVMLPVIGAIVFAHERAVVHRDVKPDNVLLVDIDGTIVPKVVDFGIARLRDEAQTGRITADGAVVGSPDYMSPEQALGADDVDERADVWSACVTLYELVTGRLPFKAANYNALMQAIIRDEPPPITDLGAGDSWLWTIVSRGLEKERAARFVSMRELGKELASWADARGVSTDCTGASIATTWLREASRAEPERAIATLPPPRSPSGAGSGERQTTPPHSITQHEAVIARPSPRRAPLAVIGLVGLAAIVGAFAIFSYRGEAPASSSRALVAASDAPPVATALPSSGVVVAPVSALAREPEPSEPDTGSASAVEAPRPDSTLSTRAKPKPKVKPAPKSTSVPAMPKEPNF
jgi:serine/threonine protein kinase